MNETQKKRVAALAAHTVRRVAVEACVDPRTVTAFLEGRPQASTTRQRVAEALDKLGLGAEAKALMVQNGARDRLAGAGMERVAVGGGGGAAAAGG